ncbi:cold shock domain-containing protein 4-like [Ipomoea triloba]|uniref:cold shock domain-containing protein 4-like n=1 Tax=Ipomoea triloba TaxID=35885 RepID=UPI00125CF848|nr:cold shock domain-containing protein 4-like [Ipomoea triloba]
MKSKAIIILAFLLIPAIFALPDHATRKHGKHHHHHRREHPRSGKTSEKDSGGGGSGGFGGFFGPGNEFGMPDFGAGYGAGFGGPNGGGYAKGGTVRPTVVCKEKGPCYGKTLRCPEKCFKEYSRAGKGYGYGGGGGGCTMDCTKKCLAYC